MMLAFLDELGHCGRYVSRTDAQYQGSPLFGFGGFLLDSRKLRPFVTSVIEQKSFFLRRPVPEVIGRELKASNLFAPDLFTKKKLQRARKKTNHLATKTIALLKECGGQVCFYGLEKTPTGSHDDGALERACLREVVEIIRRSVELMNLPCVLVIDHHNNHHRKTSLIAYSMAANGYFKELAEPPVMADSRISTAIQVADWIAGLLNKTFIPVTNSRAEWPELNAYRSKYFPLLTDGCVTGSRVELRPRPKAPAAAA